MAILVEQLDNNNLITISDLDNETISQSLYFKKSATITSVKMICGDANATIPNSDAYRCEIRPALGPDYLIDLTTDPVAYSPWVSNDDLYPIPYEITFDFSVSIDAGFYFFTFTPNQQLENPVSLWCQIGGRYTGKFIKQEFGTGIYRQDTSLYIQAIGVWVGGILMNRSLAINPYTINYLRDDS